MSIIESISKRRTYYQINKELPVSTDKIKEVVAQATELVPDAFNMKSARVVLALGAKQDELWDAIYDAFGGKVAREKIDGFKAGAGTVLYFYDEDVVKSLQEKFPLYAPNFPVWANQANGMLQFTIWTALRELGVGANLQHYNPVIDDAVKSSSTYRLRGSSLPRCRLAASLLSLTLRKKKISPFASKFTNNPFGFLKLSIDTGDTGKTLLLLAGAFFFCCFLQHLAHSMQSHWYFCSWQAGNQGFKAEIF